MFIHPYLAKGEPDICVGYLGRNWLFEIKTPERSTEHKAHLEDQRKWRERWRGQTHQVETFEQAMDIIRARMEEE
jgi:threonine synthase